MPDEHPPQDAPRSVSRILHLRPRYYRIYTAPDVEVAERHYDYAHLNWPLPLARTALVLVDVWNYHFASDTWQRMEKATHECVVPLLEACRAAGMAVIHAPGPPVAQRHPNWVRLAPDHRSFARDAAWPPEDFLRREGEFAPFAMPREPQQAERDHFAQTVREFHPSAAPERDEPVVLNGEELHQVCRERGLLFLLYAGFNTNACLLSRDYGIPAMQQRGYAVLLVRDATTGMETHESMHETLLTWATITNLEQFGTPTVTALEVIESLRKTQREEVEP